MKYLALITRTEKATDAAMGAVFVDEIKGVWQHYADNLIREIYFRGDGKGVVMITEAATADDVKTKLAALPFARNGLITAEVIELAPFSAWNVLFAQELAQAA
jgi:hypothetical protein